MMLDDACKDENQDDTEWTTLEKSEFILSLSSTHPSPWISVRSTKKYLYHF